MGSNYLGVTIDWNKPSNENSFPENSIMSTQMDSNLLHADVTKSIIGCAYYVYNQLGAGFLEKVYENALAVQLKKFGHEVRQQAPVTIYFEGENIGEYFADLLVDGKVIVELKAVAELRAVHEVQLVNYLRATGIQVGLLINFGDEIKIIRRISIPKNQVSNVWSVREEMETYDKFSGSET